MSEKDPIQILNCIAQTIYQKKGFNILAIDVQGISTMTDYFIIGEGNVDRHVIALAKNIMEDVKERFGIYPIHDEGLTTGDWVVLDYLDIVVHLFGPGLRDKYQLEQVWHDGKIVDVELVEEVTKG